MGLVSEEVEIKWNGQNRKWYEDKGYIYTKRDNLFKINIKDIQPNCSANIIVKCDNIDCQIEKEMRYCDYIKSVRSDGKYYCHKCAINLKENKDKIRKSKLKNSMSFYDWCINNNFADIIERWDVELNQGVSPKDISYGTNKSYYFKCNNNIHKSELKQISIFTSKWYNSINCDQCNSFAQWGLDNLGEDFLEKYWSDKNILNPWEIDKCSKNSVWIKCQNIDKSHHDSYEVLCGNFVNGSRCSYCNGHKVHPLDSLGQQLEDEGLLHLWSSKNKESPYQYTPWTKDKVYWKCPEGHEDYFRSINNSNYVNFRCPECQYSKGEERISNYFINRGLIKIDDEDYKLLDDIFKEKYNYYIPQKKFDKLIGLNNGLLSYDFYLPNYNLLIEYDGEFHYKAIREYKNEPIEYAEERLRKQKIHDKRKTDYAHDHNIKLLRIPYWDYDRVEEILDKYLNNLLNIKVI